MDHATTDICLLPNGKIITASEETLSIYDIEFNMIKIVLMSEVVDLEYESPLSLATNNVDKVYIAYTGNGKLLMTDLELKFIKTYASEENKLENPNYMLFHDEYLYVCDNKHIFKFDSNLNFCENIQLDFPCRQITCITGLACFKVKISSRIGSGITFESFPECNRKIFNNYKFHAGEFSTVYDEKFFVLVHNAFRIDCYNKNGSLVDAICLSSFKNYANYFADCEFIKFVNDRLFIHLFEKKIIIV